MIADLDCRSPAAAPCHATPHTPGLAVLSLPPAFLARRLAIRVVLAAVVIAANCLIRLAAGLARLADDRMVGGVVSGGTTIARPDIVVAHAPGRRFLDAGQHNAGQQHRNKAGYLAGYFHAWFECFHAAAPMRCGSPANKSRCAASISLVG